MEKTLSPDERIRRAEEIYYRRKNQDINKKSAKVNVSNKKDFGMLKKMIFQIGICVTIYVIFNMVQNSNHIFSQDLIEKVKQILSYDINIKNLYEQYGNYIRDVEAAISRSKEENIEQNIIVENETSENETSENETIQNLEIESTNSSGEQNIGGANAEDMKEAENIEEPISQMEKDAKDILKTKSLVIPLKGTITSRFGLREPETPTVPKNHTGIDIAVNEGTVFVAAMSGVVKEVSGERKSR